MKPWPGTFTTWRRPPGEPMRLILDHVSVAADADCTGQPGEVVLADKSRLLVATGDGLLSLDRVQPAGKRSMAIDEFLRGHSVPQRLPIPPIELVGIDGGVARMVRRQDAVATHLAEVLRARPEAGHVEPLDPFQLRPAGRHHRQQRLIVRIGRGGEDAGRLPGRVAAQAEAAAGLGQRRQQQERLLGPRQVEDDVPAEFQPRVVDARIARTTGRARRRAIAAARSSP